MAQCLRVLALGYSRERGDVQFQIPIYSRRYRVRASSLSTASPFRAGQPKHSQDKKGIGPMG